MELSDIPRILEFVIPGFIAVSAFRYLLPTLKRSDFEMIAESLLVSVVSSWATRGLLSWANHSGFKTAGQLLRGSGVWLASVVAATFALSAAAGFMRSRPFAWLLSKLGLHYSIWPTVWDDVLRLPSGGWVRVRTSSGIVYGGMLTKYSMDPNDQQQALFLEEACLLGEEGCSKRTIEGCGVYLRADSIESVEFL